MLPLQKNNSSPAGTGKTLLTGYLFYCLQVIINHPRYLSGIVGGVTEKRFTGVFLWTRVNEHFSGLFSGSFPRKPGNERQGNYALGLCCFLRVTHIGTRII